MTITTYNTGTASVSAGGTTVTGAGVIWTGGNAREGDEFVIDGVRALILDVVSATELVITPWQGGNESGAAYTIYQASSRRFDDVQIADDLQKLVTFLNAEGVYLYVPSDATGPAAINKTADEGQYAFQAATGKLWLMEGGVWVFVGIFKGASPKGAWDSATAYAVNDIVSLSGASYMAVAANTNDPPPSANWMLIAEKGAKGDTGATGKSYGGTSSTSLTIGTGSKTITTQAGLAYVVGDRVHLGATSAPLNWMEGFVTAYSGTSMTVAVSDSDGTGAFDAWGIGLTGKPGTGDGDMKGAIYDPTGKSADAFDSANHNFLQAGAGAVARSSRDKLRDVISVKDFGAKGDGVTVDTAAFILALDAMEDLDQPLYIPSGVYVLDAALTKTFNNRAVFLADGRGKTILRFTNSADCGLNLTYTDQRRPPYVGSMSLLAGFAAEPTGAAALTVTSPDLATSFSEGVVIDHIEIAGVDLDNHWWNNGIHLIKCWYPLIQSPTIKGRNQAAPPFSMGAGIIGNQCQVVRIRDYIGQHMTDAYATLGLTNGEGLSVIGGEIVGVYKGINHSRSSPTAGSHISDIHINAYYRCIVLNNILGMNVHDNLLYKTHLSVEGWQGIEMVGCYHCDVHDNQLACPGVEDTGGGTQLGITGVNCTDNKIHDNQFSQWPSSGGTGVFITSGCARNEVYDNSKPFNDSSPDPLIDFSGSEKNNIARDNLPAPAQAFPANDATPSVGNALSKRFSTANDVNTTITAFDDGYEGQEIMVNIADVHTAITHDINHIILKGNTSLTTGAGAGSYISFICEGARWVETSRGF